ncbi:MAG: hypothetical protein ACKVWR_08785 [Acidimicrobiales bacterium]
MYLPDELAADLKRYGIPKAQVCIEALRRAVHVAQQAEWLEAAVDAPRLGEVTGDEIAQELAALRDPA